MPVALRAYAPPASRSRKSRRAERYRRPSLICLFDTETTIDAAQRLTFGSWRVYRRNPKAAGHSPNDYRLIEEGIFYDDDLRREDRVVLEAYARDHWYDNDTLLLLVTRREFVDQVFWRWAWRERALVVGFNLSFDLSRIAVGSGTARRGSFAGGISLALWEYNDPTSGESHPNSYRPRIVVKMLGSKRALVGFTSPREVDPIDRIPDGEHGARPDGRYSFPGHFLDARTLAYVLTDRNHSLASACAAFGIEHAKIKVEEHGQVTPEYIDYNRRDVLATFELTCKLFEEYDRHPISPEYRGNRAPNAPTLAETHAYSPASVGKAYMRLMGVHPRLALEPSFPPDVLGFAMTAFYGGRAETRIRCVSLPVVYVDFLSMYPTANALMGLWELVCAERVACVEDRDGFQAWFDALTPDDCFRPETWRKLVRIALIEPDGDVLPVRARYDHAAQGYEIGHNIITSDTPMWYALADVLASWLITGRKPRVLRVIRFAPSGVQRTLRAVELRGTVKVDPAKRDFFRTVIEQRQRVKRNRTLPKAERDRLEAFLKVLANSTSYGIYAEMNQIDETPNKPKLIAVHALDTFEASVTTPERPGPFFFAPFAACITAAARLMLTLLEHSVAELAGAHVMTDTDSMAIVATETGGLVPCPGGNERLPDGREAVRALSRAEVDQIGARFEALNPYDRGAVPGSVLKVEPENVDEATGVRRQLWCYSISAKRYALYNLDGAGQPVLRKPSEHGLGHLLNPVDPDSEDRDWIRQVWEMIIRDALGLATTIPDWLGRPALARITASSPELLRPFNAYNADRPFAEQVKPFGFLLSTRPAPFSAPAGIDPQHFHLIAPYETDARRWERMKWFDLYSGREFRIATRSTETASATVTRVRTYADVIAAYRVHRESKSLAPGGAPCDANTAGLLQRRPVRVQRGLIRFIGKESNRLEDVNAGLVHDIDDALVEYIDSRRDAWEQLILPVLRDVPRAMLVRATGMSASEVRRVLNQRVRPHRRRRTQLTGEAVAFARGRLATWNVAAPRDDHAALVAYLEARATSPDRRCAYCDTPIGGRSARARYCSDVCKHKARNRQRRAPTIRESRDRVRPANSP